MELNQIYYGFKLKNIKNLNDVHSKMYEFEHLKSGATLVHIENDDTNCAFAIGFRTLPNDSTGVCHIIEHSVLCGSKKFPLKEPFVNLIKSSMATFLNAFTANDWTMYPFSSQTPKDFDNILSIYLDAVFYPLSMQDSKPFLQEGWHLEMMDINDTPSYKGVVYNEMKGAMSDVKDCLMQATLEAMYKDTSYAKNSGGDPDVIPTLTYEAYKDFHKKHYTPQNALTVLYGKMDVLPRLKFIDQEYFSKFDKGEEIVIEEPKELIDLNHEVYYEISKDETEEDNTYMDLCFKGCKYDNYEELLALSVLMNALFESNNSPLKKVLLDAKLGTDISFSLDDDKISPALHFMLEKTNPQMKQKFYDTFMNAVKDLIKNGIDKQVLLSSINHAEFKDKELDVSFPKGILFAMQMMGSFNYNMDLTCHFEFIKHYKKFREELNNGYFEALLEKYFVNSKHYALVVCKPSKTLGEKKKEAMDKAMLKLKEELSQEEKQALVDQTKKLLEYQNKVDTKEELATLPKLALTDIPQDINFLDTKESKVNGYNVINNEFETNNISYMNMYFDLSVLSSEEVRYAKLLSLLLGEVPTKSFTELELANKIKTYMGDFNFSIAVTESNKTDLFNKFVIFTSFLNENAKEIPSILDEVLLNSKISENQLLQTIKQAINSARSGIISNGMAIAHMTTRASFSKSSALIATISGPKALEFYQDLEKNFDFEKISAKLYEVAKLLFTKGNCIVSLSGNLESLSCLEDVLNNFELPTTSYPEKLEIALFDKKDKALVIPAGISYNGLACKIDKSLYSGSLFLLNHIVNYDYLWNEVRVKGGAYGVSLNTDRFGNISFGSYRDPNVSNTYEVFNNIINYLENFKCSDEELINYIIGAAGAFDKPLSNSQKITLANSRYLTGSTKEMLVKTKKELIESTVKSIKEFAQIFKNALTDSVKFTVGNDSKINESNLFTEIKSI